MQISVLDIESFECVYRSDVAGSYGRSNLTRWKASKLIPRKDELVYHHSRSQKVFNPHQCLLSFAFLNIRHSDWNSFNEIFVMANSVERT